MSKIGIYPGSFNPPTSAHIAIATSALDTHNLTRLDITVSRSALGKGTISFPTFSDRIDVLRSSFEQFENIQIVVTTKRLLSEMSQGYDLLVLGGDKWVQIHELRWYASSEDRTEALALLPDVAIADRSNVNIPAGMQLPVAPEFVQGISSTAARDGDHHMMTGAALEFANESGAWIDRAKYERWNASNRL